MIEELKQLVEQWRNVQVTASETAALQVRICANQLEELLKRYEDDGK